MYFGTRQLPVLVITLETGISRPGRDYEPFALLHWRMSKRKRKTPPSSVKLIGLPHTLWGGAVLTSHTFRLDNRLLILAFLYLSKQHAYNKH